MIVAGIGCKAGVTVQQVIAAIDAALAEHGTARGELGMIATGEIKRDETAISAAAKEANVPLMILDDARLRSAAARCLTQSAKSVEVTGVPSLSEAAALAGAGHGGTLLGPRITLDGVTCALATTAARAVP